jgi:thioredoxin 1
MQPVMASIEKKYAGQVKVTFHDVWKDDAPAKKYGIDLIPTQVFLDTGGKELMRHQGFYPEEDIDKFLQSQGLNISN